MLTQILLQRHSGNSVNAWMSIRPLHHHTTIRAVDRCAWSMYNTPWKMFDTKLNVYLALLQIYSSPIGTDLLSPGVLMFNRAVRELMPKQNTSPHTICLYWWSSLNLDRKNKMLINIKIHKKALYFHLQD